MATKAEATPDELAARVAGLLALRGRRSTRSRRDRLLRGAAAHPGLREIGERYLGAALPDRRPGIRTGCRSCSNPRKLGPTGSSMRSPPSRFGDACAVVDFGTTVTFERSRPAATSSAGHRPPGRDSIEALARQPQAAPIELGEPPGETGRVIGRSTQASLRSGIVYGFAGAVDAIARRVQRELGTDAGFIATGGHAHTIVPHCEMVDEVDDLLTLTGLRLIWEMNE